MARTKPLQNQQLPLWLLVVALLLRTSLADVGTAAKYPPPYIPTRCFGNDASQFPPNNLFAAAGDGIWDNGASCGRQYLVRCISAASPGACLTDQTIQIRIVDYAGSIASRPSASGTTMVLSETAYKSIVNPSSSAASVNIEFQQV